MARTKGMTHMMGCKNCKCGNHRGCVTRIPTNRKMQWRRLVGNPVKGCPCIKADDERIAKIKAEEKSIADEEKSLRKRLTAMEKALWGKSYEGCMTIRRPKLKLAEAFAENSESDERPASKRKRN